MKKRAVILLVLVSLLVGVVATGAGATPGEYFYLEKTCGAECVITDAAAPFEGLIGEVINYQDRVLQWPNPGGHLLETARITVDDGEGNTLVGQIHFKDVGGHFTIMKGTGVYKGLHANGELTWVDFDNWVFELKGTYHYEGKK